MARRTPSERRRDPGRSREAILDAALAEFSEHGFAGARTAAIAARAGVNQQLIAYYFGGKDGLRAAVRERWPAVAGPLREGSLGEVVAGFVRAGAQDPAWARVLVWEELAGGAPGSDAFFAGMVEDLRARQRAGELDPELDAGCVMLMLFAAALAPQVLPGVAASLVGEEAGSPELAERYAAELTRLVTRLGP